MKNHIIVTHAGSFHADEIMAVVLLEKFYLPAPAQMATGATSETVLKWLTNQEFPQAAGHFYSDGVQECRTPSVVVRTRDTSLLKAARANSDVFVLDVGGEYDASVLNFDHHQSSMRKTWDDGTPFSSTGLVWKWLESKNLLKQLPKEIFQEIEEKVVKALDSHDNGLLTFGPAAQLAAYNRASDNPDEQYQQFDKAKQVMSDLLENSIFSAELKLEAKTVLSKGWAKAQSFGDTHVLLRDHITYHDCGTLLKEISNGKADMVVIPGQGNRFSLISTPKETAFSIKTPCPSEWRGKMDQTININGKNIMLRFAHKTGFMCIVEGSHKDAQAVARYIIAQNNPIAKPRGAKP